MRLIKERVKEIVTQFGRNGIDTGGTQVQIALVTHKINHLSEHLKTYKKDYSNGNTLLKLVGQRRRLLRYLKQNSLEEYRQLIKDLGLRH